MIKTRSQFSTPERAEIIQRSQECLWSSEGKVGMSYLLDQRHLTEPILRSFGIGYVPEYVNHQLSGRIIMPIHNASGHLIAITSRKIVDNPSYDLPTYWHESYEKSFYLYGMHLAKKSIRKWNLCILVEGQFDVLQLHSSGITNAVGICAVNLSDMQVATIQRYCERMVLLLDTDANRSGQRGAQKIIERYSQSSHPVYSDTICSLEFDENIDPDEFVIKYGAEALRQLIRKKLAEIKCAS